MTALYSFLGRTDIVPFYPTYELQTAPRESHYRKIVRFSKYQQLFNLTKVIIFASLLLIPLASAQGSKDQRLEKLKIELGKMKSEGPTLQRLDTIGQLYKSLKNYKKAAAAYQMATELDDATPKTTIKLAKVYLEAGKTEDALAILESGTQKFPQSTELLWALGNAFFKLENYQSAIVSYQRAIKIDPEEPYFQYKVAEAWFKEGHFENAKTSLTPLIESDNPSVDTVLLYGQTLLESGSERRGIRQVEKLYKANPHNVKIRNILVSMLLRSATIEGDAGRLSRAIKMAEKAHHIVPENIDILMGLALFHNKLGEPQTAIQYCKKVLSIDPNQLRIRVFLGRLQRMEGQSKEAEKTFKEGLELATELNDEVHIREFNQLLNPFN